MATEDAVQKFLDWFTANCHRLREDDETAMRAALFASSDDDVLRARNAMDGDLLNDKLSPKYLNTLVVRKYLKNLRPDAGPSLNTKPPCPLCGNDGLLNVVGSVYWDKYGEKHMEPWSGSWPEKSNGRMADWVVLCPCRRAHSRHIQPGTRDDVEQWRVWMQPQLAAFHGNIGLAIAAVKAELADRATDCGHGEDFS